MVSELGYRMADNSRMLRRLFDDRVRSLGLTAVQARLLLSLERQGGQNQAHYAELLEVEPITLTRIIDRMEDAGWIERRPDPSDRRARILHLTAKSKGIVTRLEAIVEDMFGEVLRGFCDADRQALSQLLERMGANLALARQGAVVNG